MQEIDSEKGAQLDELRRANEERARKLEADKQKKVDHLKYFHAHIMKNLKLRGENYASQLDAKLIELEQQKTRAVQELTSDREALAQRLQAENEALRQELTD